MGFPTGPRYKGTPEQKEYLERSYLRKAEFMKANNTPTWNGEFGPVYANPQSNEAQSINQDRYNLLGEQLHIYDKYKIHWSIWLYKDVGLQGMIHTDPSSPWNKTIAPFIEKKRALMLDAWGRDPSPEAEAVLTPLVEWVDRLAPAAKEVYPTPWNTERHLLRAVYQTFLAGSFSDEFAGLFAGSSFEELDELAKSFAFEQCVQRDGLNEILREHARVTGN
ncbi:hypothetical protein BJX99DRAFT_262847 [Aspergillus californicus]